MDLIEIRDAIAHQRLFAEPVASELRFLRGYLDCALWSSTGDDDEPLDDVYNLSDIADAAMKQAVDECKAFYDANEDDIGDEWSKAGHDFWLTRNGHGAGFWETDDWPEEAGVRMTDASKAAGERNLYAGDDDRLYFL